VLKITLGCLILAYLHLWCLKGYKQAQIKGSKANKHQQEIEGKIKASFALLGQTSTRSKQTKVALCLLIKHQRCLLRCKEASIYLYAVRSCLLSEVTYASSFDPKGQTNISKR
jgi:hypothetical protein